MLLRAEALNQKGLYGQALAILNTVRTRVGYNVTRQVSDYDAATIKEDIEKDLLRERQLEFLGEGKRWFDLTRIGKIYDYTNDGYKYLQEELNPILVTRANSIPFQNTSSFPTAMNRVLYPIASDVINSNPLLKGDQNIPYSE
jgi:hypothetical protein